MLLEDLEVLTIYTELVVYLYKKFRDVCYAHS